MNRLMLVAGLCVVLWAPSLSSSGQAPTKFVDVAAVTGCLVQQGQTWWLSNASEVMGTGAAAAKVTVNEAKKQPLGKERYHVIGVLEEYGVLQHAGHRMLAKGLINDDGKEKRLNLTSLQMVDQTCPAK